MKGTRIEECATLGQIAAELNLKPARIHMWSARHADFPAPLHTFGKTAVYSRAEVKGWASDFLARGEDDV